MTLEKTKQLHSRSPSVDCRGDGHLQVWRYSSIVEIDSVEEDCGTKGDDSFSCRDSARRLYSAYYRSSCQAGLYATTRNGSFVAMRGGTASRKDRSRTRDVALLFKSYFGGVFIISIPIFLDTETQ